MLHINLYHFQQRNGEGYIFLIIKIMSCCLNYVQTQLSSDTQVIKIHLLRRYHLQRCEHKDQKHIFFPIFHCDKIKPIKKGKELIREQCQKILQRGLVAIRQISVNEMPEMTPLQKQPSRAVLIKRCSEKMQQIYRKAPMTKCDFSCKETLLKSYFSMGLLL